MKSNTVRQKLITRVVERLWRNVLKTSEVRPSDTFIGLGGDSLQTVEFTDEFQQRFQIELPIENLVACNLGEICVWAFENSPVSTLSLVLTAIAKRMKKTKNRHEQTATAFQ